MHSVLIVGMGSIGRRHARVMKAAGVEVIAGADLRQDRLDQAKQEIGLEILARDYKELLAKHKFDAVIVTTPTAFHTPIAIAAAEKGCHLMIEKPVADRHDGLDQLAATLKTTGTRCLIAYCYRFIPSANRLRELVAQGAIGRILSVRLEISSYLPDWHPWEDYRHFYMAKLAEGGGARLDESHGVDFLRWFFGDVESVFSRVDKISDLEIDADDYAFMLLKFRNGVVAEAHFDLLGRKPRVGVEFIGSEGTILWDRISGQIDIYKAQTKEWVSETFPSNDMVSAYDHQTAHFIDVVSNGTDARIPLEDGVKTLDVLIAALESSNTGRLIKL